MSFILLKSFILQSNLFRKPFSRKHLLEQVSQFVESMLNLVNENSGFISVVAQKRRNENFSIYKTVLCYML